MANIENDNTESDKLDVEYRQILRIIKPFVATINNNTYLSQYKVWLEKLSTTEKLNKVVRNQYLMELARQIQSLELSPPFTSNPPLGMLQPLKHRFESKCKSDESKCENGIFLNKQAMCSRWCREISHNMTFFNQEAKNFHPKDISEQDNTENKAKILGKNIKSQNSHIPVKCDVKKTANTASAVKSRPAKTVGVIHEDRCEIVSANEDESSWCDLTTTIGEDSGDDSNLQQDFQGGGDETLPIGSQFQEKIEDLIEEINGLRVIGKGAELNRKQMPVVYEDDENSSKECAPIKNNAKESRNPLADDWKKSMESLQVRLTETQAQNRELNSIVINLQKKINDLEKIKEQVKHEQQKTLEEHTSEIQKLKKMHSEKSKQMEISFQSKLAEKNIEFQKMIREIEEKHDVKIRDLKNKHDGELLTRDNELKRLEDIVQNQCVRLANEINVLRNQIDEASNSNSQNDERIIFLQKCIAKMDRLFQKSEREYCKQIEKLKQELENREKAIQIQLQTQRAEVITRCSAEKQAEMDAIVESLEASNFL